MEKQKLTIKTKQSLSGKYIVEMDAKKFERLAASMGFFSEDFLKSLNQAEKDYKKNRVEKIKKLEDLN
jgi:hypothetical protein